MWIGHLDLDAFFAKCEKLRNPELESLPVVVCVYTREGDSGAVSTCSYEARELGIKSGISLSEARERSNGETVFLPVDHEYYREKSESVISVLRSNSKEVQKTSIDEAYFRFKGSPEKKSRKIRSGVESLGLSASIGVAQNKFLAKMASEENKPGGIKVVREDEAGSFLDGKDVEEVHGIGRKTAQKLRSMGINTCSDIREAGNSFLVSRFGRDRAASLKSRARGEGSRELESTKKKQISKIRTMPRNSREYGFLRRQLRLACRELWNRIEEEERAYRSVTVISIDTNLRTRTRSTTVDTSETGEEIVRRSDELLKDLLDETDQEFRRIGVKVSDLVDRSKQSSLSTFADNL